MIHGCSKPRVIALTRVPLVDFRSRSPRPPPGSEDADPERIPESPDLTGHPVASPSAPLPITLINSSIGRERGPSQCQTLRKTFHDSQSRYLPFMLSQALFSDYDHFLAGMSRLLAENGIIQVSFQSDSCFGPDHPTEQGLVAESVHTP